MANTRKSTTTKAPSKKTKPKKSVKRRIISVLSYVISIGLMYYLFFVLLPARIDVNEIKSILTGLSTAQLFAMLAAGTASILAVGWTAATVLPGIKVTKATQASVVGQLTSVILPPPADMVIRFGMYKTFGFPVDSSSVAVILSGIARYFTVVVIPLLGILALLLSGQGTTQGLLWLIGGVVLVGAALRIMYAILHSDKTAYKIGEQLQKFVNKVRGIFKRKPVKSLPTDVVDFSVKSRTVAIGSFWPITVSNIVWGFVSFGVLLIATRFCGIDSSTMAAAYLLFITGVMLALNSLPIPGSGAGITEGLLLSLMTFPNDQVQSAFTAALILYRVFTWLWPLPVGAVAYFVWRYQIRNRYA